MIWFGQSVSFLSVISQQQIQHLFKFNTKSFNERQKPSRIMWFQVFWAEAHKSPKQTSGTRQTVQPNLKTRQGETMWLVSWTFIPPTFRQAVGDDIEPTMWTDALRRSSSAHGRTLIHSAARSAWIPPDEPTVINLLVSVGSSFVLMLSDFWTDAVWYWMDLNFLDLFQYLSKLSKTKVNQFVLQSIQRSGLIQNPERIFEFSTGMFTVLIAECN